MGKTKNETPETPPETETENAEGQVPEFKAQGGEKPAEDKAAAEESEVSPVEEDTDKASAKEPEEATGDDAPAPVTPPPDPRAGINGEHPLNLGQYVMVRGPGTSSTEGRAKIVGFLDGDHQYEVRFDTDKALVLPRKVEPDSAER